MQVMCITLQDFTNGQALQLGLCKVGSTYTVIDECIGFGKDNTPVDCYVLNEFADDLAFDKRNFATLPDTTADETQEEETETIYEPFSC